MVGPTAFAGMAGHDIDKLVELAEYDFIDLCLIPVDRQLPGRLPGNPAVMGEVHVDENYVSLHRPTSQTLLGPRQTYEHFLGLEGEGSEGAAIEYLAVLLGRQADLVVGSPSALSSTPKAARRHAIYCTWPELLNHLRLLCVGYEHFEARPTFWINEGFYYLYRSDLVFPDFRRAWFFGRGTRERRLSGLSKRLDFLCRTTDAAEIASLKTANNDTEARALFHLAFQYVLATGAFDDLAALADDVYSLQLTKHQRTLRLDRKGKSRSKKLIGRHNSSLADFLTSDRATKAIESFYPIRDALQHREFPHTVGMASSRSEKRPSVMVVPHRAVEDLAEAVQDASPPIGPWVGAEGLATVDLTWLARSTTMAVAGVVNGFMQRVPWREKATERARTQGDELWDRFSEGPASFLGWGREPVFFGAGRPDVW